MNLRSSLFYGVMTVAAGRPTTTGAGAGAGVTTVVRAGASSCVVTQPVRPRNISGRRYMGRMEILSESG